MDGLDVGGFVCNLHDGAAKEGEADSDEGRSSHRD
jgi:hypothetical protein